MIDLAGKRFGRLIVIRRAPKVTRTGNVYRFAWLCRCDCGQETTVAGHSLRGSVTRSCGCLQAEGVAERSTRHGATPRSKARWPEYAVWRSMLSRCFNPKNKNFFRYGGRGITVCERWQGAPQGFLNFIADMGRRPDPALTIERKDNEGNYGPGNCCWDTKKAQANNRRPARRRAP